MIDGPGLDSWTSLTLTNYSPYGRMTQARREGGGAEGVTVRGPGDTRGPGVQKCQV